MLCLEVGEYRKDKLRESIYALEQRTIAQAAIDDHQRFFIAVGESDSSADIILTEYSQEGTWKNEDICLVDEHNQFKALDVRQPFRHNEM